MRKKFTERNEHYSIRYDLFDNQHQQLAGMINISYFVFLSGEVRKKVSEITYKMIKYICCHFKSKEKYSDKLSFP